MVFDVELMAVEVKEPNSPFSPLVLFLQLYGEDRRPS